MELMRLTGVDEAVAWLRKQGATEMVTDSRKLQEHSAFVAWPGYATDGRKHVNAALDQGAACALVEDKGVDAFGFEDSRVASVYGLKSRLGPIASAYFGEPTHTLKVMAVTGTNGKTSTATWLAQSLSQLGHRSGLVGTLGVGIPPAMVHTGLTTPDPVTLHRAFAEFLRDGATYAAIEASSIGIVEHRLAGTRIEVALFTNFTPDHLDYHGSMEAYWEAKALLFGWSGLKAAVVNVDDPKGLALAQRLSQQAGLDLWTYSREGQGARLSAEQIELQGRGLAFDVLEDGQRVRLHSHMVGTYNVSNLLGVIAALRSQGFPLTDVVRACEQLQSVEGRMQQVPAQQADEPLVVVDYAHTPDALEKALLALKPLAEARGGQLHCVFGCGGNRDATKRPLMAGIAERIAHHAVLTTDNPRFEAPEAILADMVKGLADQAAAHVVIDRGDAIRQTVLGAGARDIVLVAGKGHEDYQEVQGVKHPFLDLAVAQEALAQRGGSAA